MSSAHGKGRLKVVLDTNIYIAAFEFPGSRTGVLWHAAEVGRYALFASPAIVRETMRVLRTRFGWPEDRIGRLVRVIDAVAIIVAPRRSVRGVPADPDDNHVLECAAEAAVDLIVSNDHHLVDLKSWSGIPIITGLEFRRTLGYP